jgi:glycerol-3-phosphate responsive antiterminator
MKKKIERIFNEDYSNSILLDMHITNLTWIMAQLLKKKLKKKS